MPHCAVCCTRIYGPGHYCTLHKPRVRRQRTREYYNYNSDSTYPGETHFRTSAGTAGTVARRRNQTYNGQTYTDTPSLSLPLAYTLAQSFAALQDTHIINSVSYCVTSSGAQTLNVDANLDREQCSICLMWFPNHEKLMWHQADNPVGCEVHGLCMREEDAVWHGTQTRHDRCFVRGCETVYRREGGWRSGVVERHVKACHY